MSLPERPVRRVTVDAEGARRARFLDGHVWLIWQVPDVVAGEPFELVIPMAAQEAALAADGLFAGLTRSVELRGRGAVLQRVVADSDEATGMLLWDLSARLDSAWEPDVYSGKRAFSAMGSLTMWSATVHLDFIGIGGVVGLRVTGVAHGERAHVVLSIAASADPVEAAQAGVIRVRPRSAETPDLEPVAEPSVLDIGLGEPIDVVAFPPLVLDHEGEGEATSAGCGELPEDGPRVGQFDHEGDRAVDVQGAASEQGAELVTGDIPPFQDLHDDASMKGSLCAPSPVAAGAGAFPPSTPEAR